LTHASAVRRMDLLCEASRHSYVPPPPLVHSDHATCISEGVFGRCHSRGRITQRPPQNDTVEVEMVLSIDDMEDDGLLSSLLSRSPTGHSRSEEEVAAVLPPGSCAAAGSVYYADPVVQRPASGVCSVSPLPSPLPGSRMSSPPSQVRLVDGELLRLPDAFESRDGHLMEEIDDMKVDAREIVGVVEPPTPQQEDMMASNEEDGGTRDTAESTMCFVPLTGPAVSSLTYEDFLHLHNDVAMPLMKKTECLGQAYHLLHEANALHEQILGKASSEALYNAACCLSIAAGQQALQNRCRGDAYFDLPFADVAPALPPATCPTLAASLIDVRLDLCLSVLNSALQAGYRDIAHIQVDDDLRALRDFRSANLRSLLAKASVVAHAEHSIESRSGAPAASLRRLSCAVSPPPMCTDFMAQVC